MRVNCVECKQTNQNVFERHNLSRTGNISAEMMNANLQYNVIRGTIILTIPCQICWIVIYERIDDKRLDLSVDDGTIPEVTLQANHCASCHWRFRIYHFLPQLWKHCTKHHHRNSTKPFQLWNKASSKVHCDTFITLVVLLLLMFHCTIISQFFLHDFVFLQGEQNFNEKKFWICQICDKEPEVTQIDLCFFIVDIYSLIFLL